MSNQHLSSYMSGRDNNLNLIRFIAASLVLVAHSYTLVLGDSRYEPLSQHLGASVGSIAVDVFFFISGLLITASIHYRPQLNTFFAARALRIFPALLLANFLCVFVVGIAFTSQSVGQYLLNWETAEFLLKNNTLLLGLAYDLPGVFVDLPFSGTINGSLWTLPHELRMYIFIAIAYYICAYIQVRFRHAILHYVCPIVTLLAFAALLNNEYNSFKIFEGKKWLKLLYMFFLGASLFLWREKIVLKASLFLISCIFLIIGVIYPAVFRPLYFLTLAYITLYLAYVPGGIIREFNKLGDYSYGMYIFAFPIQQMLVSSIAGLSVNGLIITSFVATLALAIPSWFFIEKPSLNQKKQVAGIINKLIGS